MMISTMIISSCKYVGILEMDRTNPAIGRFLGKIR